jgi:D-alanyl-D-alanine carboxypeptidase (penicillin-binding protein 5/6)
MSFKKVLKENRFMIIAAIFATTVLCIFFLPQINKKIVTDTNNMQEIKNQPFDYQSVLNSIEAKSFFVYDIAEDKPLFSKDEHAKLPLASITKLMSGLVVLDVLPETTIVIISKNDIAMEGDSGLNVGEKWVLKDLLNFSLIESSNDGMHAIASALNEFENTNNTDIIKMMNEKAISLGLNDTLFINETGLDVNKDMSGAYSSAYDVSMLLKNIIKNNPSLIADTNKIVESFVSESNIKHVAMNTNISIKDIPGLVASKTGYTDLAGGNLAIIFDAGIMHPIAIVVLGSSFDGRFKDIVKLTNITLEKLSE